MSPRASEVLEQARQLTAEARRTLAIALLEPDDEPAIDQAWSAEARRRVAQVDLGDVETLSHDEAWPLITSDD